jgi:hypothetical protein
MGQLHLKLKKKTAHNKSIAGKWGFTEKQSAANCSALVRADTTTSNFSANFQLILLISRRTGGLKSISQPSQIPGR